MEKPSSNNENPLSKIDTSELTDLLEKYNRDFGMGATMAHGLLNHIEGEGGGFSEQKAGEILSIEEMRDKMRLVLDSTGLDIARADAGWEAAIKGDHHRGSELRVDLKDGKKFVSYLQALDSSGISKGQVAGLEKIIIALTKQFKKEYRLDSAHDERMMELMGNLSDVIQEYKRLGGESHGSLTKAVEPFESYLNAARGGYLREYLMAEELLLNRPFPNTGFILRWHIDASPEFLEERWNKVIDTLYKIYQNDKAVELYKQAKSTVDSALEATLRDINYSISNARREDTDKYEKFLDIINRVKARLQEF